MRAFEYVAPTTVSDAVDALARCGGDAKALAGGQSLIPLLNYRLARPRVVVDINDLPLARIRVADGRLRVGALVRHATLADAAEVHLECPILAEAAALVGNVRVRTLGTLGGSLAQADPAAELPLVSVALGVRVTLHGPAGTRAVGADEFFIGPLTTALAPEELVTEVEVPSTRGAGTAIEEFSRRAGDFAVVAVAAVVSLDARGRVGDVRLAFGGVAPVPVRAHRAEDRLRDREPTAERIAEAATVACGDLDPQSDAFVSGAYRKHVAGVLARRALTRAVARAVDERR